MRRRKGHAQPRVPLQQVPGAGSWIPFLTSQPDLFLPPRGAEYQAEVGLLSRNILIAGEAGMDLTKLGPHIRIEGAGSISGTQVRTVVPSWQQSTIDRGGSCGIHWVQRAALSLVSEQLIRSPGDVCP